LRQKINNFEQTWGTSATDSQRVHSD
jgi:hypothetical protein